MSFLYQLSFVCIYQPLTIVFTIYLFVNFDINSLLIEILFLGKNLLAAIACISSPMFVVEYEIYPNLGI